MPKATKNEEPAQQAPVNPVYQWRLDAHRNGYTVLPDDLDNHSCPKWPTMEVTEEVIATWAAYNTGIRCDGLAAIDSDVDDAALAKKVDRVRLEILGPTPLVRSSRAPRRTWLYRREEAMGTTRTGKHGPEEAEVEIFGDRGKFTAHGIHPKSGKDYKWGNGGSPATVARTRRRGGNTRCSTGWRIGPIACTSGSGSVPNPKAPTVVGFPRGGPPV